MRAARTLVLRRERLTELAGEELSGVVGAQALTPVIHTFPVDQCLATRVCFSRGDTCVNC